MSIETIHDLLRRNTEGTSLGELVSRVASDPTEDPNITFRNLMASMESAVDQVLANPGEMSPRELEILRSQVDLVMPLLDAMISHGAAAASESEMTELQEAKEYLGEVINVLKKCLPK